MDAQRTWGILGRHVRLRTGLPYCPHTLCVAPSRVRPTGVRPPASARRRPPPQVRQLLPAGAQRHARRRRHPPAAAPGAAAQRAEGAAGANTRHRRCAGVPVGGVSGQRWGATHARCTRCGSSSFRYRYGQLMRAPGLRYCVVGTCGSVLVRGGAVWAGEAPKVKALVLSVLQREGPWSVSQPAWTDGTLGRAGLTGEVPHSDGARTQEVE